VLFRSRESFGSIMSNKGVPDTIVDFWLGHEIGEMAKAYKRNNFEDLKKTYLEKEVFLSISTGGELEEKFRAEIDDKNKQLQSLVNGLTAENLDLKERVKTIENTSKEQQHVLSEFPAHYICGPKIFFNGEKIIYRIIGLN
jgi:hypothetical protein